MMEDPRSNPPQTVIVGSQPGKPKGSAPKWLTRRTIYAFVALVALFGCYELYCVERVSSFSASYSGVSPSYCPSNAWKNATLSGTIFSDVYLNPIVSNFQLAQDAALLCKDFELANQKAENQSLRYNFTNGNSVNST